MRRMTVLLVILCGVYSGSRALPVARRAEAKQTAASPLRGGAPSVDTLLDQFLHALSTKDERALHRLRVNEAEYRQIIIPGTVKPGESPRQVAEESSQFFWSMVNQKSEDVGRQLIKNFGGHHYTRGGVRFTKGSRSFAWYIAHGDVRLDLTDENGQPHELRTGTIAEVGGRYKFIGFNTNN